VVSDVNHTGVGAHATKENAALRAARLISLYIQSSRFGGKLCHVFEFYIVNGVRELGEIGQGRGLDKKTVHW
jgi:hypothetical protein